MQHAAEKHPRVQCCGLSIAAEDLEEHYFGLWLIDTPLRSGVGFSTCDSQGYGKHNSFWMFLLSSLSR